jgi:hypothetical protein
VNKVYWALQSEYIIYILLTERTVSQKLMFAFTKHKLRGFEENIWTKEGWSDWRVEKAA